MSEFMMNGTWKTDTKLTETQAEAIASRSVAAWLRKKLIEDRPFGAFSDYNEELLIRTVEEFAKDFETCVEDCQESLV